MHSDAPALATIAILVIFVPTLAAFVVLLRRSLPDRGGIFVGSAALWLAVVFGQCGLAASGFYAQFDTMPPRFPLLVLPSLAAVGLFCAAAHRAGRMNAANLSELAWFQSFRLPLEIFVLHVLYEAGLMARHMTYEGVNFDVLVGLTALGVGWYASRAKMRRGIVLAWNVWGVGSLIVIVTVAILSAPTPFQQLSLDQPNVAPAYVPYVLLPAFFVPDALWGHVVSLIVVVRRRESPAAAAASTATATGGPAATGGTG